MCLRLQERFLRVRKAAECERNLLLRRRGIQRQRKAVRIMDGGEPISQSKDVPYFRCVRDGLHGCFLAFLPAKQLQLSSNMP